MISKLCAGPTSNLHGYFDALSNSEFFVHKSYSNSFVLSSIPYNVAIVTPICFVVSLPKCRL